MTLLHAHAAAGRFAAVIEALDAIGVEIRKVADLPDHSHAYVFMNPVINAAGEQVFRCPHCEHEIAVKSNTDRMLFNDAQARILARRLRNERR